MVSMRSVLTFVAGVIVLHIVTYYLAGTIALVGMSEGQHYPPSPNAIAFLRDPTSSYVQSLVLPAQALRGLLFAVVLYPFRFNAGVKYGGYVMKWDTVIEQKAIELGRFLVGRSTKLDFSDPSPSLMTNEHELRSKVIRLTSSEARRLGIQKITLHYLRKRARHQKPFTTYEPVLAKLTD